MKHKSLNSTQKQKTSRARLIGYVLFGITVLACAAWVMYQYYLIAGWNLWAGWGDHPYDKVMKEDLSLTLIIVALSAGSIGNDKKSKGLLFIVCYLYVFLLASIVPTIWHMDVDFDSIADALEHIIGYGSLYSIFIIPSFAISSFVAWVTKALIRSWNDRHKANDGSAC